MLSLIAFLFSLALIGISAYAAWTIFDGYRKATGTVWERLLASSRDSATILWSKFLIVLSGFVANADKLADMLNMPDTKAYIEQLVKNPKTVAAIMLSITAITIASRLRTLR